MRVIDPVTVEIITGKLLATADEMGIILARTSMSPVIYEVLDFACGITDADAQLVAQTNGITLFTGTFAMQVQSILRKYAGRIAVGDVYMTNDPYAGGTHTADIALIKPVFFGDRMVAFAIAVAHWSEVGGKVPGSLSPDATEVYQEGVQFPQLRLFRGGELVNEVVEIIAANVRLPKMSLGDLNAEIAAVRIADARLQEICSRYGVDTLLATFADILDHGERMSRQAVREIPDGVYTADDRIDGDGITASQIPIHVSVTVAGDEMTIDFTGTSPSVAGPINCARGALMSACKTIFKAITDPQAPSNEGWFRPLRIVVPDDTVFSATKPTPTGWYYEGSAYVSELVWKALAPAAPHRLTAGSYVSLCASYIVGFDPRSNELFVHIEPHNGGWGAGIDKDGESGLIATTDGDTYNYPVELVEGKFPLRLERYSFNVEDGVGAGRFRGGYGLVREYRILTNRAGTYASIGRSIERPWGVATGLDGTVNYMEILADGQRYRGARVPHTPLQEGSLVRIVTGGGGGYGPPTERDPDRVLNDVLDDLITPAQARTIYGVVIRGDLTLDADATQRERARRTKGRER
ncbi:MAG: hydantoinase B/oxoprolinase family protein [Bacillati bacterium ANGP1]|uniref:Hydantoinase B/oxoprolinase family protein n=1 Tax=Candidatus Segetimicrobium genomatis TaxID=2569760 RepID=A0A537L9K7_9BACT|nr:MAG: hydantoinase B/oxoprolinase family protein [Terrabacteria group bacterium ANGP1]